MAQEVIEVVEREVEVIEILERGLMGMTGPAGPQANINYLVVSSSQAVSNRQMIAADTSGGSFTLTLPPNPAAGDAIDIFDYSDTFDTNPLTIARNGQNIEGLGDDLIANVEGAYFTLIFTGGTRGWQVVPRYGVSGLQNVLTTEGDLLYRGGSAETRLGIGTAGQILKVNSGATAPEWGNEVMSAADKTKLDGIAAGAEVNVNADWNAVSGDAQILNKPATFTPSSHTHGNITNDGKIGATSGLPVVTTTDGAVTTLALGTANQVLRVNSGATGVEFGAGFDAASPPAIGSTTPNSGAFTTLSASAASGAALTVTDTTTSSDLNYPLIVQRGTTRLFGVRDEGVAEANLFRIPNLPSANVTAQIDSAGLKLRDTNSIQFSSTANIFSPDTFLLRDGAAGTLAQRNGLNPQTFRIYGQITGTDVSATGNYERGYMRWSAAGGVFQIGTEKGSGGGLARAVQLHTDGSPRLTVSSGGSVFIGDGSTQASQFFGWSGNVGFRAVNSVNGVLTLLNWAETGFDRIQFGGTTNLFPALKRSSTTLQVRLADDTAFAPFAAGLTTLDGGTVAASSPVLNLSQTWNNPAVAFTGLLLNVTNTNSVATSYLQEWQEGGVTQAAMRAGGFLYLRSGRLGSPVGAGWAESAAFLYNAQARINSTSLVIGGAGTGAGSAGVTLSTEGGVEHVLALRNAANPQTFRIYGQLTGSDVSATGNYERGYMRWSAAGGVFQIGTEKGSGGGLARALEFQTDGLTRLTLTTTNLIQTRQGATLQLFAGTASNHSVNFQAQADGVLRISNNAATDFARLQFGGTDANFPALRRSSTALQVRLADDSAFAPLSCGALTLNGNLDASTRNLVTDTTTGTKIGTATTQKIGFFDKTPVVQPTAVADATDAATVITQLNALLSRMRDLGLIAT